MRMASAMTAYEKGEREHAAETSAVMRQFDQTRDELTDLHRQAIEGRDRERADALASLRRMHQERQKMVLDEISAKLKTEQEEELRNLLKLQENAHDTEVKAVEQKLCDVRTRLTDLESRIGEIQEDQAARAAKIADEAAGNQQRETHERCAIVQRARQALAEHSETIERRKSNIIGESDAIDIDGLQGELSRRMCQIQEDFHIGDGLDMDKRRLLARINQQNNQLKGLQQDFIRKRSNSLSSEESMLQEAHAFEQQLTDEMKEKMGKERKRSLALEAKVAEVRNVLMAQFEELIARLEAAKAAAIRAADRHLIERARVLEECPFQFEFASSVRMGNLEDGFHARMARHQQKMDIVQEEHMERVSAAQLINQQRLDKLRATERDKINELNGKVAGLKVDERELDLAIELITTRECPDCTRKRELLMVLKDKVYEQHQRLVTLNAQITTAGKMMDRQFIIKGPTPAVRRPVMPVIKRPIPLSSLSIRAMRFTM
jgi:hypothetical protein